MEFGDGLPKIEVRELKINYSTQKLVAGTFGRGIWESDLILDCGSSKNLNSTVIGNQNYSGSEVNSSSRIIANSHLDLVSGGQIILQPGFSVEKGSTLNCLIGDPCE